MARTVARSDKIAILAYPPPYRSWMAISSDPDCTTHENWHQVHAALWEELQLPFADTFFIRSVNESIPGQVALAEHPEILDAHPHDSMHTWGDYVGSQTHAFGRKDAEDGLRLLRDLGCSPLVWSDHSHFCGNLTHRPSVPAVPTVRDASGHDIDNLYYTLDLVHEAGVRYVWDGTLISEVWGQDREVGRQEWYRLTGSGHASLKRKLLPVLDAALSPVKSYLHPDVFSYAPLANRQYYEKRFPDGQRFYAFPRFGRWELGDIDGLGKLLAPAEVDRLLNAGGTAIVYTHLGKRHASRLTAPEHVPSGTMASLRNVADQHHAGRLHLTATSKLLDYLVLRDHISVDGSRIEFHPDPIRYPTLSVDDLRAHVFGVTGTSDVEVVLGEDRLDVNLRERGNGVYELRVE